MDILMNTYKKYDKKHVMYTLTKFPVRNTSLDISQKLLPGVRDRGISI